MNIQETSIPHKEIVKDDAALVESLVDRVMTRGLQITSCAATLLRRAMASPTCTSTWPTPSLLARACMVGLDLHILVDGISFRGYSRVMTGMKSHLA